MAGTPGSNFIPSGEIVEIKSGENSSEGGYSPWIMHPGSPPSEGYPGQGPFLSLADMYSNLDIEPWTPGHQGIDAYFPTYESFRLAVIDWYGGNSANGFARIYVKVEGTSNAFQWALSPTWTWAGASAWPGSYGPPPHVSARKWPNTILFQLFWGHSLIPGGFTTALAHAYDTGVPAWDRWVDALVEIDGVRKNVTIQVDNWKRTFSPEELAPGRKITQIDMNYDFVTVTSNDSLSQNTDFLDDLYMAHGRYPYPIPNVDPEIIEGAFDLTRCRFAQ